MATRTEVIFFCDLCGSEDQVETHTVIVDNHSVEADLCRKDWQGILGSVAALDRVGRKPKGTRKQKRTKAFPWPGEVWAVTHHAMLRMGERKITMKEAVQAAENPELVTPGEDHDTEVRVGKGVKVVVKPHEQVILTVSYRDEEVAEKLAS